MSIPRFTLAIAIGLFGLTTRSGSVSSQLTFAALTPGQFGQFVLAGTVADVGPYRLTSDLRIKRMHLVRPDLIGYPILQDIYA